jgi:hypothetical protein
VPYDEIVDYGFRFTAARQLLVPSGEPDEYVLTFDGQILWSDPEQEDPGHEPVSVGEITAYLIQAGRACNDEVSLFEACDCHSQELMGAFEAVYDSDDDRLKEAVSDGCGGADALVLSRVLILPEHRGRRLGQLAMLRAIADCGTRAAAAVCKPFPLQSEHGRSSEEDVYKLDEFGGDHDRAMQRLRQYWSELGFKQVETSEWFALDLSDRHPDFEDLVSGR